MYVNKPEGQNMIRTETDTELATTFENLNRVCWDYHSRKEAGETFPSAYEYEAFKGAWCDRARQRDQVACEMKRLS